MQEKEVQGGKNMAEQEKREKAIEEMKNMFCYNYPTMCKACCFEDSCLPQVYSERLYDAGYRKEEEVRKETIIQVAKWLNGLADNDLIYLLLRKFGVEVEE